MSAVKIHGLMRSGTNYLQFMVERNFGISAIINEYAWKHGGINPKLNAYHLIVFKNIHAWLSSIYDYSQSSTFFPKSKNKSLSEFIRSEFLFLERGTEVKKDNPIQLYNLMHESWLSTECKKEKLWIDYGNMISCPEKQMAKISSVIKKPLKNKKLVYPCRNVLPHEATTISASIVKNYKKEKFYEQKEYMKRFLPDDLNFIESQLNHVVRENIFKLSGI
jgi:hypothetical protein